MLNPFGTSPIKALWQGFVSSDSSLAVNGVVTRTGYGCVAAFVKPPPASSVYTLNLYINNPSVDANTYLPVLKVMETYPLGYAPHELSQLGVAYGSVAANAFSFFWPNLASSPTPDVSLVNVVIFQGLPASLIAGVP